MVLKTRLWIESFLKDKIGMIEWSEIRKIKCTGWGTTRQCSWSLTICTIHQRSSWSRLRNAISFCWQYKIQTTPGICTGYQVSKTAQALTADRSNKNCERVQKTIIHELSEAIRSPNFRVQASSQWYGWSI